MIEIGPNLKQLETERLLSEVYFAIKNCKADNGAVFLGDRLEKEIEEFLGDEQLRLESNAKYWHKRTVKAEKLLKTLLTDMQDWDKDGIPVEYLADMHDTRRFLGGEQR